MTKQIQIEKIDRGSNIREEEDREIMELAESIKQNGLLNPITVVRKGARYEVVAGHRRFLALKILQEPWVECNILEYEPNETELLCIQLQENCCRKNMSAWEYADLFKKLIAKGKTQKQIARMCGKSEVWVNNQFAAAATLERYDDITQDTKSMSVAAIRNKYGKISVKGKDRKPYIQTKPVIITKNNHCYTIRVNDKEAEKELINFLKKFRERWLK